MQVIKMNILEDVKKGIIFHQVNARGVMGAGIAAKIKAQYPQAYTRYRELYLHYGPAMLGTGQLVQVGIDLYIANICGQLDYGREGVFTNYLAVERALADIQDQVKSKPSNGFYFPYKMGCGLAGGNWDQYSKIIEKYFPTAIICKL